MTAARIDLIHELVSSAVRAVPDRVAIIAPDGEATTFAEFDRQVRALAGWVSSLARRGERVAVIADNGVDFARLYYAVPRSGRVLTLINQRLSPAEQSTQLAATEPTVLIGDLRYLTALPLLKSISHVVPFDDPQWQRAQDDSTDTDLASVAPDDPAWLLFTSGSTGTPKPVVHTHRSITTAVRGTVAGRSVRSGGVYLLPFPMCHIAGYNMLVHHSVQSTVLPVPVFRPELFAAAVNAHGVTSCSLAPTMLHSLLAHLDESGTTLPTLREIAYGSAAIPAELLRRAIARLDVDFHQGYGMTETGGNVTFLGPDEHRAGARGDAGALAAAGRPHSEVEVRIAADTGEILLRGAQVAPGLTTAADDGWFATGDVGRIDDGGRLVVVDRLKDVIITGGENVSSREVEDVLSSHPDVDMAAVVGVPDDYWGEAICAVVVARRGSHPSVDALVAHVRAHLTAFKRPRHVLFVDALPMTSNGKVAKPEVRRLARDQLAGQRDWPGREQSPRSTTPS
jgi:acyl-CoA synthetase (AMP-forming)/AMP-acid ligase II